MKSTKGPAIFLAQFVGDDPPFNTFELDLRLGGEPRLQGVQIPAWDGRFIDLEKAANSAGYCQELTGTAGKHGVAITELATHLQGQLVAVNPVYDDGECCGKRRATEGGQEWAAEQVTLAPKPAATLASAPM